ncbi:MAG: glycosyltransferase [Candidatus Korobacteraceae bacterium]
MDYGLSGESIVCFAGEDWWYHHPHSKNHILKRLAAQNKVLFVNSISMGLPSLSNPDFFLKVRRKLKSYVKWLRKAPEGLWVMTPINLPVYGIRVARKLNWFLLVLQVRLAMLLIGIRSPVLWIAIPSAADIVGHLGEQMLLYQVSDKYDANEDSALSAEVIRSFDRKLKQSADVVMFSGRKLFQESCEPNRYYLEQAVDFDHFATEPSEAASEIAHIPRPILGYFGAMDYVMDTELMAEVSRLRPEWHWVMLGLKSNLVQVSAPNIHFLGSKAYAELPRFVKRFDVCVLPWRQDNAFTSYGSAIKVREYLATGKPVVISPLYEYLCTPGIRVYRSPEEFVALVEDALRNDTAEASRQRQAVVRNCDWNLRTRQVCMLIQSLKKGEKYAYAPPLAEVAQI